MAEGVESAVLKPRFHVLARAVIRHKNRVLLARAKGAPNTFLPGGHVEPGESLTKTLTRELKEELGVEAQVETYLGAIEHVYILEEDASRHHEINHLFTVTSAAFDGRELIPQETHLSFLWAEVDDLGAHALEPKPLQILLAATSEKPAAAWWASTLAGNF